MLSKLLRLAYLINGDELRLDFGWAVICRLGVDGGGAGVTLNDPLDNWAGMSINGFELFDAFEWVTIRFSCCSTCCDCFIFFSSTNLVSSLRRLSLIFRRPRSRSQISAADSSCGWQKRAFHSSFIARAYRSYMRNSLDMCPTCPHWQAVRRQKCFDLP